LQLFSYFATAETASTDVAMETLHKFSDAGRLASRHHESKWDAWYEFSCTFRVTK
jgi:hypothetical protein